MQAFRLGAVTVDLDAGRVTGRAVPEDLTPTEVRLLDHLSRRSGDLVPREELLAQVWGYRPTVRSRTIDTTISRVRAKLEEDPSSPRFLHTVYGRGVRLDGVELVEAETPAFPTRFVGRVAMAAELAATVRRSRLTTIWGPGGAGKSRLLGEVLPRLGPGAILVGCGAASDGRDLDLAVAQALGVDRNADLGPIFARTPTILALDECEAHLAVVAERVRRWLGASPRLRVIATSRSELRVPGEQLFPVGALEVDEATRLFVDRARLREPTFDAPDDRIALLVSLVDRLPLAVEIAASQVHVVGLERLEALLAAPLGAVDVHGSLGEVIERSYALLGPEERRALVAASLLEAPFDVDDLAAVTGAPLERALRHLDTLVRHSLVAVRSGRHRPYAPVRDRARRDLSPDDPARERHARWFGRLGTPEQVDRCRTEPRVREALWRSAADLAVAFEAAGPDVAVRCGHALLWCLARQGRTAEGLALAARLDALPCAPRDRVSIANIAAPLHSAAGDERAALAVLERVVPLLSTPEEHVLTRCAAATRRGRLGDADGVARELDAARPHAPRASNHAQFLGTLAYHSPRPLDEARMREALAVARAGGNLLVEVECLGMLAHAAHVRHADWDEGRRSFARLLEICGTDDTLLRLRLRALVGLGQLERSRGDLDAAEGWLEQAATLGERGGIDLVRQARVEIARVWNQGGRHDDALGLVEPLAASERPPPHPPSARALLVLAEVRERLGEREAARRILGRVLQHGATGTDVAADALDLSALLEEDDGRWASFDDRPVARVRRHALASLLARRRGDVARADAERDAALRLTERLGLLPGSEAASWLRR